MLLSLNWLRDFVPYDGDVQALADRLTMIGNEVEEVFNPFEQLMSLVVGHVVECEKHPEADKLSVCTVDVGDETLQIVCGAPNVAAGQKVPVAKVGTVLPGDLKLKKAKIRGIRSMGMICSERELELSDEHDGIMVLPDTLRAGDNFVNALGLETTVFDIGITPNRADCLSVLGIARETAAAFNLPLTMPTVEFEESGTPASEWGSIVIPDSEFCPLYMARIIDDVSIVKSPDWMRFRLLSIGQRPISNIVDVTNYVMFELGQPQHAFDKDLLRGNKIEVAPADEGTKLTTLDGQERTLTADDLLILDGEGPVALAGVMGGESTEIHDKSENVLLECAVFRPGTVRRTARRLALPSEASYRFERGVDQIGARFALDRAAQLMVETGGGVIRPGTCEAEPRKWKNPTIRFRPEKCNRLLGHVFTNTFCRETLTGLNCEVDSENMEDWSVVPPSHRLDLEREVDLFEEVARMYGMDRIKGVIPRVSKSGEVTTVDDTDYGFLRRLKRWGRGAGLREAINYSFVGTQDLDRLNLPEEGRVMVANPLSEDQNVMRTKLAPGLLFTLRQNLAQGNNRLRIFEVAKSFVRDPESDTETSEHALLGLMLYGARHAENWPWPGEDSDYLDLKGLVEHLFDSLKLGTPEFELADDHPYLAPCVTVSLNGEFLGEIGKVKPDIADFYHARKDVWMGELDADRLMAAVRARKIAFRNLPVFPPSRRDITLSCPVTLPTASIEEAVSGMKTKILESIELVAVFNPDGQEEGDARRNLSFRMTYRSLSKTLKDKEVDKEHKRITDHLLKTLPVEM